MRLLDARECELGVRPKRATRIQDLEKALADEIAQSREHAARLAALSGLAHDPQIGAAEALRSLLLQGAGQMRGNQNFFGLITRLEGDEFVVDHRMVDLLNPVLVKGVLRVGDRIPIEGSLQFITLRAGKTQFWNDLLDDPRTVPLRIVQRAGGRSAISTAFHVGATTYFLMFWSMLPTRTPFRPDDCSYIELLASIAATRLRYQAQLAKLAYQRAHDVLTGLPNRAQFCGEARSRWDLDHAGAVAIVDVDNFRHINATYGTGVGDAVLESAATALAKAAIDGEIVARFAGDAFVLYFSESASREALSARLAVLIAAAESSSTVRAVSVTLSAGVAVGPADGADVDTLIAHADTALKNAKESNRGGVVFFKAGMKLEAERRTLFTTEIALAIERDELVLHFQPHIDLATHRIHAAEALVRWNHPTRGLLAPAEFIPLAEDLGLIGSIDAWVMRESERAIAVLRRADPEFRVYFNMSAQYLTDSSILDRIVAAKARGAALSNLGVEITETVAMRDIPATLRIIAALRDVGMKVALDDFGTGYSSLAVLKRVPIDLVKLDRSFVSGVLCDQRDAAIAEAVLHIAARNGFSVVAEGVESAAELSWFTARGCELAQGFLISKALPLAQFLIWLNTANAASQHPDRSAA